MADIAKRLSGEDVTAVVAWLASQPVAGNGKPVAALPQPPSMACGSAALPAGRQQP
jgi:cytochrome c553